MAKQLKEVHTLKRIILFITAALIIAMVCPGVSALQSGTDIICNINSVYEFAFPQDTAVKADTDYTVGYITVKDLLLEDGEYLTVEVINSEALVNQTDNENSIPYKLNFNATERITEENINDSYKIQLLIDENDRESANQGIYSGSLTFNVHSSLTQDAVISANANISLEITKAKKPVLSLKIGENGNVEHQGNVLEDGAKLTVDESDNPVLQVNPDKDYKAIILLNGKDITARLKDGKLILSDIVSDSLLDVRYVKNIPPGTGETVAVHIISVFTAAALIITVSINRKKET